MAGPLTVSGVDIDRDPAHTEAQHELAKPIYAQESGRSLSDWLDDVVDRLLARTAEIPGAGFTVAVVAVLVAVAVVIAIRVARNTIRSGRTDHALFEVGGRRAAECRAAAEHAAAQGDWGTAIRQRLRAVARGLEEGGILRPLPGRTANELARDAGAALPGLAAELSGAAAVFNDVTYGERPGTEAGYRRIADLDDRLRAQVPAHPVPAAAALAPR
ncbi:DUF4129 domain-containing protein [Mycobacterium sp. 1274756.6]|uniref:DUF4129 domain-containing protein n=1 Tax=Mycobacterium sp. 1274756.6 TaxID=1834076 RepID=UPI001E4809D1|nr:DUF4129 domain-containing protein [Mycobacterium sp. 1274756.6]